MTTKLAGKDTYFLPFNQSSNGAGQDGGKGNPPNPDSYPTAYLWEQVFQKDSMMDILQRFLHFQVKEEKRPLPDGTVKTVRKQTLIFPRCLPHPWRDQDLPVASRRIAEIYQYIIPFTDVKSGAYYYDTVLWAVEQKVASGTSVTMFSPNATVTRG